MCTPLAFAIIVATLGSAFQHGFHIGFVNIPEHMYLRWYGRINRARRDNGTATDVTLLWSVTLASFSIGALLGSIALHFFAANFGRKMSMLLSNGIALIGVIVISFSPFANSYELFILGRFIIGISVGLNSGLCPIYLIEISPDASRGAVGSAYGFMMAFALLMGQVCSFPTVFGRSKLWMGAVAVTIIPTFLQTVALLFCPESPKYLYIEKEDEDKAEEVLCWFSGSPYIEDELEDLRQEAGVLNDIGEVTVGTMFSDDTIRNPLIICTIIMMGHHLCGSTAVLNFSCSMLEKMRFAPHNQYFITLGLGIINLAMAVVCMLLVEVIGRKPLLMISFVGMAFVAFCMTLAYLLLEEKSKEFDAILSYVSAGCMGLFITFFGLGAPIPWFYTAELNNQLARTRVTSFVVTMGWLSSFYFSMTVLVFYGSIGYYIYLIFLFTNICTFIFIFFTMRETMGLTSTDIIELFY